MTVRPMLKPPSACASLRQMPPKACDLVVGRFPMECRFFLDLAQAGGYI